MVNCNSVFPFSKGCLVKVSPIMSWFSSALIHFLARAGERTWYLKNFCLFYQWATVYLHALLDLNFKERKLTRLKFLWALLTLASFICLKLMRTLLKFQECILPSFFLACFAWSCLIGENPFNFWKVRLNFFYSKQVKLNPQSSKIHNIFLYLLFLN